MLLLLSVYNIFLSNITYASNLPQQDKIKLCYATLFLLCLHNIIEFCEMQNLAPFDFYSANENIFPIANNPTNK